MEERIYFHHKLMKYTNTTFSANLQLLSIFEQLNRSNLKN